MPLLLSSPYNVYGLVKATVVRMWAPALPL
nr:MAG TPA: hypothetical protein [Caudoviricetes sp.]